MAKKKTSQPKDIEQASWDAAIGNWHRHEPDRVQFWWDLRPRMKLTLWLAGLTDDQIELVRRWLGVPYNGGMSDEVREAKRVLERVPMLNEDGSIGETQFWLLATEHPTSPIWQWRHYLEAHGDPKTELGKIALQVIEFWRWFGEKNWPDGEGLLDIVRRRLGNVPLSALWSSVITLQRAWHGRDITVNVNPEDIYEGLSDASRGQVEIDVWSRDDEIRAGLDEKGATVCSDCGVRSLTKWGWAFGDKGSLCPRSPHFVIRSSEPKEPSTLVPQKEEQADESDPQPEEEDGSVSTESEVSKVKQMSLL